MATEEAIFRSADMSLVEVYIPTEKARDIVLKLGDLGNFHMIDMNKDVSAFQRLFVKELRKLDNTERQLRYFETVIHKQQNLLIQYNPLLVLQSGMTMANIEQLTSDITLMESRVSQLVDSHDELNKKHHTLLEKRQVLNGSRVFFEGNFERNARISIDQVDNAPLLLEQESLEAGIQLSNLQELALNYVVGSIPRAKVDVLNKILWRALRGNLFMNHAPLDEPILDPRTGELVEKDVFIVFTHGELLLSRVRKIIDSLDGNVYSDVHSDADAYHRELQFINTQMTDLDQVIEGTHSLLYTELFVIADMMQTWRAIVKREKMVYTALNMFREESRGLVAEGWVPTSDLDLITNALSNVQGPGHAVLNVVSTNYAPPTFHRTNKFTQAFQSIVDAYGTATYQEVNPGLATVVTFPFMFAIMFGDLGHGFVVFLVALVLVMNERKLQLQKKDEIFDMAFNGRYIILLMGLFSMYTGVMYNDIFSKSMTLFKSGWKWPENFEEGDTITATSTGVYPFGLDWAWHGTENNLIFTNSYKMKLSILMGFAHMTYSFMFSLVNYRHRHSKVDIVGNFIPGLIFMQAIFGYLSVTIIYKWSIDWVGNGKPAPGLLNMLINMFLSPGNIDDELYSGQAFVQVVLLLFALVCVPWLLLYKPMVLRRKNNKAQEAGYASLAEQEHHAQVLDNDENAGEELNVSRMQEPEEFNFGDIMIHQVIHTIEFCLNCVSHTASYLRLWALSLAHAQLSSVLWTMTIGNAFSSQDSGSVFAVAKVVILFAMWFSLTIAILVMMEGTSAMLHSLRLHWVEAMSKFFEGEGYAYTPFTFVHLHEEDAE